MHTCAINGEQNLGTRLKEENRTGKGKNVLQLDDTDARTKEIDRATPSLFPLFHRSHPRSSNSCMREERPQSPAGLQGCLGEANEA